MRKSCKRRRMVPAVIAVTVAIVLAITALAPGVQRAEAQDSVIVEIVDFAFAPTTLTVEAGTTVTWVNQDAAPHTATSDGGEFDTGRLASGQSASITFDTPGTYTYHCEIHPNMTASIVVLTAGGATGDGGAPLPGAGVGVSVGGRDSGALAGLAALAGLLLVLGAAVRRRAA